MKNISQIGAVSTGLRRRSVLGLKFAAWVFAAAFAVAANAQTTTITDTNGADDEPGQKDLNQFTFGLCAADNTQSVSWNWDEVAVAGGNSLDACSLYDTNGNGFADAAVCVVLDSEVPTMTVTYTCGDTRADRCTQSRAEIPGAVSSCSVANGADPFHGDVSDAVASCSVDYTDFGATCSTAQLINVCSYPSSVPGSDPSDCVAAPNAGFLTIIKSSPDEDGSFTFDVNATGQTASLGMYPVTTVGGTGSQAFIPLRTECPNAAQGQTPEDPDYALYGGASCSEPITYDITETALPADFEIASMTCDNGGTFDGTDTTGGVIILPGQVTTCTVTNELSTGMLQIEKITVNDNGGLLTVDDFGITTDAGELIFSTVTSDDTASSSSDTLIVTVGTYDLSEIDAAGYDEGSWACERADGTSVGGGAFDGATVTVGAGEDILCSITNDDSATSLTLIKKVINDNGGDASASAWTLNAGADSVTGSETGAVVTENAGTYALSESGGPDGYTGSAWSCDGGSLSGSDITVALGEDITCTITNDDDTAGLTLVKNVVNDNGGTADASAWMLNADANSVSGSESGALVSSMAGTYALSESGGPGGYTGSAWSCVGGSLDGSSVTVGVGEAVVCTIVNDDNAPSLVLEKQVVNDDGGGLAADAWTLVAEGYDAANPMTGTYQLSESGPGGYAQTSLTCSDNPGAEVTSVTLGLGDSITCVFVNDDIAVVPPSQFEGCTPGYWRQTHHYGNWADSALLDTLFSTVFGVGPNEAMKAVVWSRGGGERALTRHAVAAYLNAASSDVAYQYTTADVIALVQQAYASGDFESAKDLLAAANEAGCDLGRNPGGDDGGGDDGGGNNGGGNNGGGNNGGGNGGDDSGGVDPAMVQGCTPGYWRQSQHYSSWPSGSLFGASFDSIFGVGPTTELKVLAWSRGGGEQALLRHAVAAYLNAEAGGVDYMYSTSDVIAMVQAAYASGDFESTKDMLAAANEAGCPL